MDTVLQVLMLLQRTVVDSRSTKTVVVQQAILVQLMSLVKLILLAAVALRL